MTDRQDDVAKLTREAVAVMDALAARLPVESRGSLYEEVMHTTQDRLRLLWGKHWNNDE